MTTRREKSKPQQNKQWEATTEQKPKESRSIALEAGKFCLDIAKLVFGGVIRKLALRHSLRGPAFKHFVHIVDIRI